MHAIKKMDSDGMFGPSEEIGSAYYLSKWSFIRITTIDGEEINIEKDGTTVDGIVLFPKSS